MQDRANELLRILLPRRWVNRGETATVAILTCPREELLQHGCQDRRVQVVGLPLQDARAHVGIAPANALAPPIMNGKLSPPARTRAGHPTEAASSVGTEPSPTISVS